MAGCFQVARVACQMQDDMKDRQTLQWNFAGSVSRHVG